MLKLTALPPVNMTNAEEGTSKAKAAEVTTTVYITLGPENLILDPYRYKMVLSSWISIPSYLFLIFFSSLMFYVVLKHFRSILKIYISVLIYLFSQLLLLAAITATLIVERIEIEDEELKCKTMITIQTFTMILPGYSIVLITVVRSVFLKFPLSFLEYLKIRYQLVGFGIAVMISGLIATAPILGLSEVRLQTQNVDPSTKFNPSENTLELTMCSFGDMKEPSSKAFYGILLGIGFILPVATVVALYIFIYRIVVCARVSHRKLTNSSSITSTANNEEGNDGEGNDGEGKNEEKTMKKKTKKRCSKSMKEKEQRTFPWSIIAILGICFTTTIPFGVMTVFTVEITNALLEKGSLSVIIDIFYALLQVLIGCSPLVYMQSTRSMRKVIDKMVKNMLKCNASSRL